ncbi:trigger factor, partial [Biomphalaria glabrata]
MAITTKTRWRKEESKFEYITENPLKLSDLELDKCLKRKLLVQLKLLPTNVNRKRAKKFVVSLIKAIDYKGGLLIELDDHVANLIGSEVLMLKQKVTMIIKASQFEDLKEEYKQSESVYSNFKYFVVVDDNSELKVELTENEKLYRCELNIYGSKRRTFQRNSLHEIASASHLKGKDNVDSSEKNNDPSLDDDDDDDCDDDDDDDDDDNDEDDDDDDDDDEEDDDKEYIDYVKLVFGERKG